MRGIHLIAGVAVLAVVLAPAGASAQRFFGNPTSIPASVTSMDGRGNFNHSIPPSVTSIRPSIFPTSPFVPTFHRHHRQVIPIFVPIYTGGYGYPYSYYPDYDPMVPSYAQPQPAVATAPVEEPQAPAQTVFENRPGYKAPPAYGEPAAPPAPSAQTATATPAKTEAAPMAPEPPTILVFKDGHKLEIGNYAIVGETLYNMSGNYRSFKIALADLDLDATVKANEERGLEFHLPVKKNG